MTNKESFGDVEIAILWKKVGVFDNDRKDHWKGKYIL
jgi:hypothetical protein